MLNTLTDGVTVAMFRRRAIAVISAMLLLAFSATAEARPVTAEWDANTDIGVTTGYNLFYGTAPGTYNLSPPVIGIEIAGINTTSHVLNLTPGATYYFMVRAHDSGGILGPPSDEVSITLTNAAPVLTNPGSQASAPGNVVSFQLASNDPDGDSRTFTNVSGLPTGLSFSASGLITGTVGAAGTYTVSATVSDGNLQDNEVFTWRVISYAASPAVVAPGGTVSAVFSHGPGGIGDWMALAVAGAPAANYLAWKYTNGLEARPGSPIHSGSVPFSPSPPLSPGNFELRYFRDDSLTVFRSIAFTVVSAATISASPNPVHPSGYVNAVVAGGPGNTSDWVGLYTNGAAHTNYSDWRYLNGQQAPPGTGVASATVPFAAPDSAGTYQLRFFSNGSLNLLAQTSFTISGSAPLIVADLPSVAPGTLTTAIVTNGPANAADWVSLAVSGSSLGEYVDWRYLNGQQTPPGAGSASASVPFTAPASGLYVYRLYANNTGVLLAQSPAFLVTTNAPSLSATPGVTGPGGGVRVVVNNGPGNPGDWVALYPPGAGVGESVAWQYLNGLETMPGAGLNSATLAFVAPTTPATYTAVLYLNNSTTTLARVSFTVSNAAPRVTPELTTVPPATPLSFSVVNGPGSDTDWLALYQKGAAPAAILDYLYLNGTQTPTTGFTSAQVQFTTPVTPGQYEVAFYSSNSLGLLARSVVFTVSNSATSVTPASTTAGQGTQLNVTVAGGPANAGDWVALYPFGAAPSGFVDWKYLNGSQTQPGSGVAGATIPFTMPNTPGTYQFVFYRDNGLGVLARSVRVTVP